MSGNNVQMAIELAADGGIFFDPIPGDMIYTYTGDPQVKHISLVAILLLIAY